MRKLEEFLEFKNGKKRPKTIGRFPVYGGNGILDYTDSFNLENGIVIGRVGAYCGNVFMPDSECWVSDNAIMVKTKSNIDITYAFYLLKYLKLNERSIGSGQPLLTQRILNDIEVDLPKVAVQKEIGQMLRIFDNKIKLNNQINKNLEEQADLLFSDFFLQRETIPNGWEKGSLLDIADYLNGLAMQKYRPNVDEIGLPVLKIKELRQGSCDTNSELCSPNIRPEYIISDGDIIFSWSGSLLVDFWCGGTCGLNQHLFKVTSSKFDKWFYYAWTKHHLDKFIGLASAMATTMGHIKRGELAKSEVLIPNETDYQQIANILQPIYDCIISNRIENVRLANLRDELLPRLMFGKLDVSTLDR